MILEGKIKEKGVLMPHSIEVVDGMLEKVAFFKKKLYLNFIFTVRNVWGALSSSLFITSRPRVIQCL